MFCIAGTCSEVVASTTGHRPALAIVQLGVPEQQLHGTKVLCAPVDQRRFGAPYRVRNKDACVERGPHLGYDPNSTQAAKTAVKAFLRTLFKLD